MMQFSQLTHAVGKGIVAAVIALHPKPEPAQFNLAAFAGASQKGTVSEYRFVENGHTHVGQSPLTLQFTKNPKVPFAVRGTHLFVVDDGGETRRLEIPK